MKPLTGQESYLSSGDYLGVIRDFALSRGVALDHLLSGTQVEINDLINPPELVDNVLVSKVAVNLYGSFENPLGASVELGQRMNAQSHGSLGIAVQYAESLGDAYEILKTYYHTRINSQDLVITEHDDVIHLEIIDRVDRPIEPPEVQRFFNLATLVSIASNTYAFLDHSVISGHMCIEVDLPRPDDPPDPGIPSLHLKFDARALALTIPVDWKDAKLKVANALVASAAEDKCKTELQRLEPKGLQQKVEARLRLSPSDIPSLEEIAAVFHMSPATFKRHLKEEGVTYQALKNQIRFALAKELLRAGDTLEAIAQHLGFSDASNFNKAFKQWAGVTPKSFLTEGESIQD